MRDRIRDNPESTMSPYRNFIKKHSETPRTTEACQIQLRKIYPEMASPTGTARQDWEVKVVKNFVLEYPTTPLEELTNKLVDYFKEHYSDAGLRMFNVYYCKIKNIRRQLRTNANAVVGTTSETGTEQEQQDGPLQL